MKEMITRNRVSNSNPKSLMVSLSRKFIWCVMMMREVVLLLFSSLLFSAATLRLRVSVWREKTKVI